MYTVDTAKVPGNTVNCRLLHVARALAFRAANDATSAEMECESATGAGDCQ
jgi:hypothetical protein